MERSEGFGNFLTDANGAKLWHCYYPTMLDTYGRGCAHDCCNLRR